MLKKFCHLIHDSALFIRGIGIIIGVICADLLSKSLIMDMLRSVPHKSIELTSFLNLTEVWNYGISFGLFRADGMMGLWGLRIVTVGILCFLLYLHAQAKSKLESYALALIIGGAIGNIHDRFVYGAVYDFIDVHFIGWHFWTFNIADSAITIGAILLFVDQFFCKASSNLIKDA